MPNEFACRAQMKQVSKHESPAYNNESCISWFMWEKVVPTPWVTFKLAEVHKPFTPECSRIPKILLQTVRWTCQRRKWSVSLHIQVNSAWGMGWLGCGNGLTRVRGWVDSGAGMGWLGCGHGLTRVRGWVDSGAGMGWLGCGHGLTRVRGWVDSGAGMGWLGCGDGLTRVRRWVDSGAGIGWLGCGDGLTQVRKWVDSGAGMGWLEWLGCWNGLTWVREWADWGVQDPISERKTQAFKFNLKN